MKKLVRIITVILSTAATSFAQHAGDIELTVESIGTNGSPRIVTNAEGSMQRVFGVELGEDIPSFANEPGYDSASSTFPVGTSVGFNILDALRKWNGTDFNTIPSETLRVEFAGGAGGLSRTTPSTDGGFVDGFALSVASDGTWHRHLEYSLGAPSTDGVYLLQLELFSTATGLNAIETSLPYYLVINQNDTEANHSAAEAFVQTNIVPEPTALAALGLGAIGLLRRRRL